VYRLALAGAGSEVDDAEARWLAAHRALDGTELPVLRRPRPAAARREMERIRNTGNLWFEVPGVLPGDTPVQAASCDGFAVGYGRLRGGLIVISASRRSSCRITEASAGRTCASEEEWFLDN
jgi:hypothetical protein